MANGRENTAASANRTESTTKDLQGRRIVRLLSISIAVLIILLVMSYVAYEISTQVRDRWEPASETIGVEAFPPPDYTFDFTEEFRVNTANSEGNHFIRANISLAYYTEKEVFIEELEKRSSQMRNMINLILMSKSKEQLASVESRIFLQEEIRASINHVLVEGKITEIYFTNFLLN